MKRIGLIVILFLSAWFVVFPQTDSISSDSVKVSALNEIIVEGRTQRVIEHGVEYTPGKQMKRAATDATDLLLNMQIPMLKVSPTSSSIKTLADRDVTIFINYRPATDEDLKGIQTRDVLKVEVLEYPQDSRFNGAQNVVNFIMQEYEWGGYTKFMANGITLIRDYWDARIYSKFAYKKMTFDLNVGGSMSHSDNYIESGRYIFRDIYFQGRHLDEVIKSTGLSNSLQLDNQQWINFRAAYSSGNTYITHSFGFGRFGYPRNRKISDVSFRPEIMATSTTLTNEENQTITPYMEGYYWFQLPKKNYLSARWYIRHSGNRRRSFYHLDGTDPILNNNRESSWSPHLIITYTKKFAYDNSLRIALMSFTDYFNTQYSGSYNDRQRLLGSENMLFIEYMQTYRKKLYLYSRVGVSYVLAQINGKLSQRQWNPRLGLQLQYRPDERWSTSIEGWWGNSHPQASYSNTAIVQVNELMWRMGNPDMRNVIFATAIASANYVPVNWFSVSANLKYEGNLKIIANDYFSEIGKDGLVSKSVNNGDAHKYNASLSATFKLLKNKLIFNVSGSADKTVLTGICGQTRSWLQGQAYAKYYLKNFNFMMYVSSPEKTLDAYSDNCFIKTMTNYGLQVGYGNSDFSVQINFHNWFRGKGVSRKYFRSSRYEYAERRLQQNCSRRLSATITYTFGYGKKLRRSYELDDGASGSSAILK